MIVLDDWCEATGRIPSRNTKAVIDLNNRISESTTLLPISKAVTDVSTNDEAVEPRGEVILRDGGFDIWTLKEPENKSKSLFYDGKELNGTIEESVFIF